MRWPWVMVSMAILFLVPMVSAEGAEKVTASGERYVVVLAEEVAETEAARLASVYGGVLEPDEGHGGRQFVVRMASSRARMMSLDPHVVSVSEQSRHLTPLPTGSGSTTLGPYAYDGSGNIRSIGPEGNQEQYIYDALGRLTSATAGVTNTQTYQYDAFGNRTVVTRTGSNCTGDTACERQGTYLAETNHLNNNGAVYDTAGNLTAYVADQYAYDAAGMLARASVSGDRQYLYTAFDERIAVYDGTFNWRWTVRSEDGKVLREFTSTNDPSTGALGVASRQWVKDYVWRNGQLLATENRKVGGGTVTEHYHLDHLGTPRLVTDGTGLKLATHTYYAFGAELMGAPESPETAMKFTGHERDITGTSDALDNMHARYYSSLTGRFLSVDPSLDLEKTPHHPQAWNRYSYVENNPIGHSDPTGKCTDAETCAWDLLRLLVPIVTEHTVRIASTAILHGTQQHAMQRLSNFKYAKPSVMPSALSEAQDKPPDAKTDNTGAQDKKLSGAEIDNLEEHGHDVHDLKQEVTGDKKVSKYDLYKDKDGNIFVKPKNGKGTSEPTGLNINDFTYQKTQ